MNRKRIEYLIMATAVILLIYGGYALATHKYLEHEDEITDSITMYYPSSSGYSVDGEKVEFRNQEFSFYNMDVSRLNSTDKRISNLLNHFANLNRGTVDYKNETCYLLTMEFDDGSGFRYHSMIIPYDSFNKTSLKFTKDTYVYLIEGNNREFVVDTGFNSKVKT